MNYQYHYDLLIDRAKNRILEGYSEKHHVIPRCLGGSDESHNIVVLTAREHFIAHLLLIKIYPENRSLIHAAVMMCMGQSERKINNKMYDYLRNLFSKAVSDSQTGTGNSQWGTKWIHNTELKQSKKIPKDNPIPFGWKIGRVVNFDKQPIVNAKSNGQLISANKNKNEAERLYELYKNGNFSSIREFCRLGHYKNSHVSLTKLWKKYIIDYNDSVKHGKAFIPR